MIGDLFESPTKIVCEWRMNMSLESWIKEFYSTPAEMVDVDASLQHSLTKWIGAREENLNKHDLIVLGARLCEKHNQRKSIAFTGHTCALCYNYPTCDGCPLSNLKDETSLEYPCINQYNFFQQLGNPEPMIALIQSVIDQENQNKNDENSEI